MLEAIIFGVLGLITSILGSAGSILGTRKNNSIAAAENYDYGEKAAENAQQRQIETYQSLYSLPAQMEQINSAGLSPGLIYSGTGGASGATPAAPQGEGAGGQQGKFYDLLAHNEMSRMASEIALNEAKARNLNVNTNLTEKWGEVEIKAKLENLWADTDLKNKEVIGQDLQNCYQEVQNTIADATQEEFITQVKQKTAELDKQLQILDETIKQQTWETDYKEKMLQQTYEKLINENKLLIQKTFESKAMVKIEQGKLDQLVKQVAQDAYKTLQTDKNLAMTDNYWNNLVQNQIKGLKLQKQLGVANIVVDGVTDLVRSAALMYLKSNPVTAEITAGIKLNEWIQSTTQ